MDPCPFVRLIIESLALKFPFPIRHTGPNQTSYYCKLHIHHFPTQTTLLPLSATPYNDTSSPESSSSTVTFDFDSIALRRSSSTKLRISVYSRCVSRVCGLTRPGKLIGRVEIVMNLDGSEVRPNVIRTGWFKLGNEPVKPLAKVHLVVRTEPDPRFVFQFGAEPECSPVVFQVQGNNVQQPVFSCKFSADRNSRSRSVPSDFTNNNNRGWIRSFSNVREKPGKERKGWMIMIYDLSGSPVAAASMITPFVPSPGTDRVSYTNPGAWLILRPYGNSWKPWGRLESWREKGKFINDKLGFKFDIVTENGPVVRIPIAETALNVKNGGEFCIDGDSTCSSIKGFVMASSVEGIGKVSKPRVEVSVRHVMCIADAAVFVALSAAVDLSMDACQLFSRKVRKEVCLADQDSAF